MLANVPRRHVRQYKQIPLSPSPPILTPTSSTLPSPGAHFILPESDTEDENNTLISSSPSLVRDKKLAIFIPSDQVRYPLVPSSFEFKSAQPILGDALLPRGQTTTPGLGLPKRRTLAQRFRERKARRCIQTFPVGAHSSAWHLALADPNLDGLDLGAEEEGFDTVIRIQQSSEKEEEGVTRWGDKEIRKFGGKVHIRSVKPSPSPSPKSGLFLTREDSGMARIEINLFIPSNPSDLGLTALTLAQMAYVSQYPDLGRVLLTTPPERGVDALSLAAFCFATPKLSPGEMIRAFNVSMDTPLDTAADEASWKWRGAVSWDGLEALDGAYTDTQTALDDDPR